MIEAILHTGAVETRYVRAGTGETVLLLLSLPCAEIARSPTLRRLSERRRVIAAAPPPGCDVGWLRDLIDGLGLDRPELTGKRELAPLLLAFAEAHPERIAWVTLVDDEPTD